MFTIREAQVDTMSGAIGEPAVLPCRTWIEIRLLDGRDRAVPDVKYRIQLPNASIREGKLDNNGTARLEDIPHGQCVVTFLELDEESWSYDTSDSG